MENENSTPSIQKINLTNIELFQKNILSPDNYKAALRLHRNEN